MTLTRRELEARYNSVPDAIGPRTAVLDSGLERGCRVVTLSDGAGLQATINLDRACDMRDVTFNGQLISFTSPAGDASPAAVDHSGVEWARTWGGGLLTTCGFRNVGPPEVDASGESHELHGRAGSAPARNVGIHADWDGDTFVSRVTATFREARLFADHIECRRTWTVRAGSGRIEMHDEIRNVSFTPEHLLVMYHINLGWPLLAPGAEVAIAGTSRPRSDYGEGNDAWRTVREPKPGFVEEVHFHEVAATDGRCAASLINKEKGLRFEVSWNPDELSCFTQWQSMLSGGYALAFEPGNCLPLGRTTELEAGRGDLLEAGATKDVTLALVVQNQNG